MSTRRTLSLSSALMWKNIFPLASLRKRHGEQLETIIVHMLHMPTNTRRLSKPSPSDQFQNRAKQTNKQAKKNQNSNLNAHSWNNGVAFY